jgi:cytochrome c556
MVSVRKTLKFGTLAAVAVAVGVAFGTSGSDVASAAGHAYKERNAAMKSMGGAMKKLGAAVGAGNNADAAAAAKEIAAIADNIPAMFKVNAVPADSRAKPEIWTNMDDFTAKAAATAAAANKVASDAMGGSLASDPKAVVGSIGATCGGCHKVYRAEKS